MTKKEARAILANPKPLQYEYDEEGEICVLFSSIKDQIEAIMVLEQR